MKWTWIAAAVLAFSGLGACGGSDDKAAEPAASKSPTLALLDADKACAQVEMVNNDIGSLGQWPIPTYKEYGAEIADVAAQSSPEIADALTAMSDQALKVGSMTGDDEGLIDASSEWATKYQEVATICMRTDSPISRLS